MGVVGSERHAQGNGVVAATRQGPPVVDEQVHHVASIHLVTESIGEPPEPIDSIRSRTMSQQER